jgi:hypothetical protein
MRATRIATRALRLIALCGSLAVLISVASPADDAVQHELAPCRARHVARILKVSHPAAQSTLKISTCTTPAVRSPRLPTRRTWIPTENVQFSDGIYSLLTGDRSPPRFLL